MPKLLLTALLTSALALVASPALAAPSSIVAAARGGTVAGQFSAQGGALGLFVAAAWPLADVATGGARVAAGDLTGDGHAELVTVPAANAPAHVRVFAAGINTQAFIAGDPVSKAGATVAAGDLDGDGKAEIVVGSGSTVRVVDAVTLATRAAFSPFSASAAVAVQRVK